MLGDRAWKPRGRIPIRSSVWRVASGQRKSKWKMPRGRGSIRQTMIRGVEGDTSKCGSIRSMPFCRKRGSERKS